MQNPTKVKQRLTNPVASGQKKRKRSKGNLPFIKFRRRARKTMFDRIV